MRYNPELNKNNKPIQKPKKTKEDLINEAKLALEAKAITSKAVIAELEKIPSVSKKTRKTSHSEVRKSLMSVRATNYISRLLTNKQKKTNATKKINKNKNSISNEELLFIQNEFTPSNIAINLTDEKIYKS